MALKLLSKGKKRSENELRALEDNCQGMLNESIMMPEI
jgi:hypothetical protein